MTYSYFSVEKPWVVLMKTEKTCIKPFLNILLFSNVDNDSQISQIKFRYNGSVEMHCQNYFYTSFQSRLSL